MKIIMYDDCQNQKKSNDFKVFIIQCLKFKVFFWEN